MKVLADKTASLGRSQRPSKYEYLLIRYSSFFDFSGTKTRFCRYVVVKYDCFREWLIPLLCVTLYWNNLSGLFCRPVM